MLRLNLNTCVFASLWIALIGCGSDSKPVDAADSTGSEVSADGKGPGGAHADKPTGPLAARNAEGEFLIDGAPLYGTFTSPLSVSGLREALDEGVNLFMPYRASVMQALLDPSSERGRLLREHGAKVMPHVLGFTGSTYLEEPITPGSETIRVNRRRGNGGVYWVGDEAIRCDRIENGAMVNPQRGFAGTAPSSQPAGRYILFEDGLRNWMARNKNSSNLWGVWIMDDFKGDQMHAMQHAYRIIKEEDVDEEDNPLGHVVVAGFNHPGAVVDNFAADLCDAVGLYVYPSYWGRYLHNEIEQWLSRMLPIIEERDPGTPFIGVFQGFEDREAPRLYRPTPTPLQMRQQVLDFAGYAPAGLMFYNWRRTENANEAGSFGMANLPALRAESEEIARELRRGDLKLSPRTARIADHGNYPGDHPRTVTLLDAADLDPAKLKAEALEVRRDTIGGEPVLRLDFDRLTKGEPVTKYPFLRLPGDLFADHADWTGFGHLVLEVHNLSPGNEPLLLRTKVGSEGERRGASFDRLVPPGGPHTIAIPVDDFANRTDVTAVDQLVVMRRLPMQDASFAIRRAGLTRPLFQRVGALRVPELHERPPIDGTIDPRAWSEAPRRSLKHRYLTEPPIRSIDAQVATVDAKLAVRVTSRIAHGDPELVVHGERAQGMPTWRTTDDTVRIDLWHKPTGTSVTAWANSAGRLEAFRMDRQGRVQSMDGVAFDQAVTNDAWDTEMILPVDISEGGWHLSVRRHHQQIGPLTFPNEQPSRLHQRMVELHQR